MALDSLCSPDLVLSFAIFHFNKWPRFIEVYFKKKKKKFDACT